MNPIKITVWFARILFGITALVACVALFFDAFLFDAPGSTNLWTVNLALAPLVFILTYTVSLAAPPGRDGRPPTGRARLQRALLPVAGLAWYGLAWLAIETVCGGRFSC